MKTTIELGRTSYTEILENVTKFMDENYADKESFREIARKFIYNEVSIGILYLNSVMSAIDGFEKVIMEETNIEKGVLSSMITPVNKFDSKPFYKYEFHHAVEGDELVAYISFERENGKEDHYAYKIKSNFEPFRNYMDSDEMKAHANEFIRNCIERYITNSFEYCTAYMSEAGDVFDPDDLIKTMVYTFANAFANDVYECGAAKE